MLAFSLAPESFVQFVERRARLTPEQRRLDDERARLDAQVQEARHRAFAAPFRLLVLAAFAALSLTGCAAFAPYVPLLAAGLGTAGQIAEAIGERRGAPVTREEFVELQARVKALEDAERKAASLRGVVVAAKPDDLPVALNRSAEADGERGVAKQEIARFVETLSAPRVGR